MHLMDSQQIADSRPEKECCANVIRILLSQDAPLESRLEEGGEVGGKGALCLDVQYHFRSCMQLI